MRILRLALTITLAATVLQDSAHAQVRNLSFEERVKAQQAIERVYYSHQNGATLPFEQAVPATTVAAKVREYLLQSVALEEHWGFHFSDEALYREQIRVERTTRFPDRLAEIYETLGSDPYLIRECFIRPVLSKRLLASFFSAGAMQVSAKQEAHSLRQKLIDGFLSPNESHPARTLTTASPSDVTSPTHGTSLPPLRAKAEGDHHYFRLESSALSVLRRTAPDHVGEIGPVVEEGDSFIIRVLLPKFEESLTVATYRIPKLTYDEWWSEVKSSVYENRPLASSGSEQRRTPILENLLREPSHFPGSMQGMEFQPSQESCLPNDVWIRNSDTTVGPAISGHAAVWTGNLMIVWGGGGGRRYDPLTDSWLPISMVNAPAPRNGHTTLWTGERLIIWGGREGSTDINTGKAYDPAADVWTTLSTAGAPVARYNHTGVWTGGRMLVWGGFNSDLYGYLANGGQYDPLTDTWTDLPSVGAPGARTEHLAVWTGSQMVVWGGRDGFGNLTSGGRYDPQSGAWSSMATRNAPLGRTGAAYAWSGQYLLVWGGHGVTSDLSSGGYYDPVIDAWATMSALNAPSARTGHTGIWSGTEFIVWGGGVTSGPSFDNGGRYNPTTNSWTSITSLGVPAARSRHSAVWTGSKMLVWGGDGEIDTYVLAALANGGKYDPQLDSWLPIGSYLPPPRFWHSAVWTGNLMVVWGGYGAGRTGARYDPLTDTWTPTSTTGAPNPRYWHSAVWTGTTMIIWGGSYEVQLYPQIDAAMYDPISDHWTQVSNQFPAWPNGNPSLAVWTGTYMFVWNSGGGGRYDPGGNFWLTVSRTGSPPPADGAVGAWTGQYVIVWSNSGGGKYDPVTNSWTSMSGYPNSPDTFFATAAWTSGQLLIWNNAAGARYDSPTDSWSPLPTAGAPTSDWFPTSVWTGREFVVWGGETQTGVSGTGSRYTPARNTWQPVSTANAPLPRSAHTAVWTGDAMLIWGGYDWSSTLGSGGTYSLDVSPDDDADGFTVCMGDCADNDPNIYPSAPQLCDGNNNDCNSPAWPTVPADEFDFDGDNFRICQGDCDDTDASVYAGASQICDGKNNDCRSPGWPALTSTNDGDDDGDGLSECQGDCDDSRSTMYPGAAQLCDGLNNDCADPVWPQVPVIEVDGDGDGYRICAGDCDDLVRGMYPGAPQLCDGINDDCNDSNWPTVPTNENDSDGDGYRICAGDCDDTNLVVHPGAVEGCNGIDDNCSGAVDEGGSTLCSDSNTCTADVCGGTAGCQHPPAIDGSGCSDGNACTQTDSCQAGVCTGSNSVVCVAPDACHLAGTCNSGSGLCSSPPPKPNGFMCDDANACTVGDACQYGTCQAGPLRDADNDGQVDAQCGGNDCNDTNPAIHLGALEICNQIDDNCNGLIDDDAVGLDSDTDGIHNACDNCRFGYNPTQQDTDHDGIGNACDNCIAIINPDQADLDSDQRGDICDNCPSTYNPFQDDWDMDRIGDACDNCIFDSNPGQSDIDFDFEGDVCDLNDGLIWVTVTDPYSIEWQLEEGFLTFNEYRGDLAFLRQSGLYTQDPATTPLAERNCNVSDPYAVDGPDPGPGQAVFYLVTGLSGGAENSLGTNSAGNPRTNSHPCP